MKHDEPADHARTERAPDPREAPDPLDAFPTEAQVAAATRRRERHRRSIAIGLAVAGLVVAVGALATWVLVPAVGDRVGRALGFVSSANGMLAIDTTPPGWDVLEGARTLGTTPLRTALPAGPHSLVLRNGSATRTLSVVLPAGMQVFHHLDLRGEPMGGVLHVATTPPGAAVEIDGVHRGVSPVDVAGLEAGEHSVSVAAGGRTVGERVTVVPGRTTTLLVPMAGADTPAGSVGFVSLASPIELQVFDGDSLVGSSRNERIMVMPGRRTLRLANAALGFERTMTVTVEAGAAVRMTVPVPNGTLSVNAVPWAEVLLDGRVIGETPIANHSVPLGSHEVVLRNPKFPEQRRTVVISLAVPARIGVDLRQ
jgi:hypothetical protein